MNQSSEVLIRDMDFFTFNDICVLLDAEQFVEKNDARMLAAKIGMKNNQMKIIFYGLGSGDQKSPAEQILASWGTKNEATVGRLREILKDMDREDVISVFDKKYPPDENITRAVPVQDLESQGSEDTVDSPPAQVFISYQWDTDSQIKALKLKEILGKNNLSCWMDEQQLHGGDQLHPELTKAINDAKVMISIVTGKYLDSINCQREVSLALTKKPAIPVIPIHLEKVDTSSSKLGTLLAPIVYISCHEGLSDDKLRKIVESVCSHL